MKTLCLPGDRIEFNYRGSRCSALVDEIEKNPVYRVDPHDGSPEILVPERDVLFHFPSNAIGDRHMTQVDPVGPRVQCEIIAMYTFNGIAYCMMARVSNPDIHYRVHRENIGPKIGSLEVSA